MDGIGTVAAIGGIILAIVLIWAIVGNTRRTSADRRRTEDATRALKASIDRQDKVTDPDLGQF